MADKAVNKVILIGRTGKDVDLKYTNSGKPVASVSLAVNRNGKEAVTDWFRLVAWDKLAEVFSQHVAKGTKIYIEGRLQVRKWEGQDGTPRETTEVVVSDLVMLSSKQEGQASPAPKPAPAPAAEEADDDETGYDFSGDDLPF